MPKMISLTIHTSFYPWSFDDVIISYDPFIGQLATMTNILMNQL